MITTGSNNIGEAVWRAVLRRDRAFDGKFVYAALTTGIYCRPSCAARHPHRRNTLIFTTGKQAERDGFIACRRCHPRAALTPSELSVKAALDYVEAHIDQKITLASLSQVTGLSANHLQQKFGKIVGLSPKAFCDARRLDRLKHHLKGGASVINATYAAGYGSSRALYEKASHGLGMTPAVYARGGASVRIRYAVFDSDSERTLVAVTEQGVCAVLCGACDDSLVSKLREEFPKAILSRDRKPPPQWAAAVRACRATDPLVAKLSGEMRGTLFRARVWRILGQRHQAVS